MGTDKATLPIHGIPQAEKIAQSILDLGIPVTVLGREPIPNCAFLADAERFEGPLKAIARFRPNANFVFVTSCDVPLFDAQLIPFLKLQIDQADAVAPFVNGFRQPLSALYHRRAFDQLKAAILAPNSHAMTWLDVVDSKTVSEQDMRAAGLNPLCAQGANTREELEQLLK